MVALQLASHRMAAWQVVESGAIEAVLSHVTAHTDPGVLSTCLEIISVLSGTEVGCRALRDAGTVGVLSDLTMHCKDEDVHDKAGYVLRLMASHPAH